MYSSGSESTHSQSMPDWIERVRVCHTRTPTKDHCSYFSIETSVVIFAASMFGVQRMQ
jgi:hypothetical protein